MTNHMFGINWLKYHQDQHDLPHIERMGYRSFTLYEWTWNNRDFCRDLLAVARQDAIFLDRDHPKSEEKDDLWKRDPAAKGRAHADDWAQKVREGIVFTPLDRTYFLGLNEPNSNEYQRQIDAYNEAYCRRMAEHGLRAAAYSFGVGHPSTVGLQPDTPVDWSWYDASAAAILEGNHIAAFHEYGAPGNYGWGFWCNRLEACPHAFDVVLDECGIDHGVLQSGYLYGWAIALKPEEYVRWLDGFQLGMAQRAHTRKVKILGYNIFSFDHGDSESKDWHSFDIRPLRPLLEAFQWSEPSNPNVAPTPQPVTATMFVTARSGLNLRSAPEGDVLIAVPFGELVSITGVPSVNGWLRATYQGYSGWIASAYVSPIPPEHTVHLPQVGTPPEVDEPTQPVDTWARSRAFIAKWEGGYQNVHNDAGNWTGGVVGEGELKGTKYGISAASYPHLDIKNLTMAQADAIYRTDYWQRSGADKLPWPACLLVFDTAVLHGVGKAQEWLNEVGPNPYVFAAKRLRSYTKMGNWDFWGKAWSLRVADLLEECAK